MARTTLSAAALKAFNAQESGDFPIILLTISHASLSSPIRISSDSTQRLRETAAYVVYGSISRGNEFVFFPFQFALPEQDETQAPKTSIKIDNVDRSLLTIVRSLQSPPTVSIEVVMSCSVDTVEVTMPDFEIMKFEYDSLVISGDLVLDQYFAEPFPGGVFCPDYFPGLF